MMEIFKKGKKKKTNYIAPHSRVVKQPLFLSCESAYCRISSCLLIL